jgi:hypothetical protein
VELYSECVVLRQVSPISTKVFLANHHYTVITYSCIIILIIRGSYSRPTLGRSQSHPTLSVVHYTVRIKHGGECGMYKN